MSGNGVENKMENKITDKEKAKDIKIKDDIHMGNFGETKDKVKLDAQDKSKHVSCDL